MSTSNAGQKLVLWSAKKYVHSSISDTITDSGMADNNVTGNADLTGLSYYPIAVADSYTLKDLNVTFDYDGLYTTAENTFTNSVVSDNYIRDPGATSTDKNQHYIGEAAKNRILYRKFISNYQIAESHHKLCADSVYNKWNCDKSRCPFFTFYNSFHKYAEWSSEEIRYKYKEKQAKYSIHG